MQILKTFLQNIYLLSKNWVKRYDFIPFFKLAKDGDLRKSIANGSKFHSLAAHCEKALSRVSFISFRGFSNNCWDADNKFLGCLW